MTDKTDQPEKGSPAQLAQASTDLMSRLAEDARIRSRRKGSYKRTPELIEEILLFLRAGLSIDVACETAGICAETLMNWRRADPDLDDEVDAAASQGMESLESVLLSILSGGRYSTGDHRRDAKLANAVMWIMGKRHTRYSDRIDVTSNGNTLPAVILPTIALPSFPVAAEFNEVVEIEDHSDED